MQSLIDYILKNKEWIFSGIGIFGLSGMIWFLRRLLFSNSPRTDGESGSHTTASLTHPERMQRESDIEVQDSVGHRFEFLNGVIAYAKLRGSYTIEGAKLFVSSFKSNDECKNSFAPLIHARACYLLEKYPFAEAKLHRREVEIKLKKELQEEFAKCGIGWMELLLVASCGPQNRGQAASVARMQRYEYGTTSLASSRLCI